MNDGFDGPRWHTNGWPFPRPLWLRRRFPGRWTTAEVAAIHRRAAEQYQQDKELWT